MTAPDAAQETPPAPTLAAHVPAADARQDLLAPLADAYRRIDPANDGWPTEVASEAISAALSKLAKAFENPLAENETRSAPTTTTDFACGRLRPGQVTTAYETSNLTVKRGPRGVAAETAAHEFTGAQGLRDALADLRSAFGDAVHLHTKFKLVNVDLSGADVQSAVLFHASDSRAAGAVELSATWRCVWRLTEDNQALLRRIEVADFEQVEYRGPSPAMFADATQAAMGDLACFREQLAYGVDHWRGRMSRQLGLTVTGNHGATLGDVDGDGLDDLYLCAEGGLPNRLLLQNADGTLRDESAASGVDFLDPTASALFIDVDNDRDQDLVVGLSWRLVLLENDGRGRFAVRNVVDCPAQIFSLAAADVDVDGDLDLYVCGYHPDPQTRAGDAFATPVPFHDANNGGRNLLLMNQGQWRFADETSARGLDENNSRYSYAASWEDLDNDGDLDLYVANDFGRNNLYRNAGGKFHDVAGELHVEDMAAGMSTTWADYDRDGWMDLYVSNMFSSAGNRISYQRQFNAGAPEDVRRGLQ
ncbi:MAG: VCBS repeat-containing protein, partial [Planctomycetales bacterium]|nr:VCBS repeat-containing protein [Planctomycetales bacterium]